MSLEIFSEVRARLQHRFQNVAALVRDFTAPDMGDESTQSKRTFYLISLMLFISLVLVAPDKIPQTFAASQVNPEVFDRIQEIVRKAVPFIG